MHSYKHFSKRHFAQLCTIMQCTKYPPPRWVGFPWPLQKGPFESSLCPSPVGRLSPDNLGWTETHENTGTPECEKIRWLQTRASFQRRVYKENTASVSFRVLTTFNSPPTQTVMDGNRVVDWVHIFLSNCRQTQKKPISIVDIDRH